MKKVAALLLTAHPGTGHSDDSAMTKIDGRESALRSMELMTNREPIAQVILCIDTTSAEAVKAKIGSHLMFMGTRLAQGTGWHGQLKAGAAKLDDDVTHVLVHDAARPAVPYTDLEALLATDVAAVALALPLRGVLAKSAVVPGEGKVEPMNVAEVLTPRLYDRTTFDTLCETGVEPSLLLLEASPLNVRCGDVPAGMVKAMIGLLPKPKVVQTNPFEEAQW